MLNYSREQLADLNFSAAGNSLMYECFCQLLFLYWMGSFDIHVAIAAELILVFAASGVVKNSPCLTPSFLFILH